MIKILFCSLFALSLISCNPDENSSNPEDPKNNNGSDNENGSDPTKQYTLFNKTGDDDTVTVVLFSSREKLKKNEAECSPVILQNEQCLTITGDQFPLLQVTSDDKVLCGNIATSCNPDNYEITKTGWWLWADYRLSKLQEEDITDSPSSRKNEKAEEEVAADEEEAKACVPLKCNTPEAPADSEEEEADEEN